VTGNDKGKRVVSHSITDGPGSLGFAKVHADESITQVFISPPTELFDLGAIFEL
jgi:hypothetical protein